MKEEWQTVLTVVLVLAVLAFAIYIAMRSGKDAEWFGSSDFLNGLRMRIST